MRFHLLNKGNTRKEIGTGNSQRVEMQQDLSGSMLTSRDSREKDALCFI